MELKDIIVIIISGLGLIVSVIALVRDLCTRKKVNELRDLEIERLKMEKERQSKAIIYGYIDKDSEDFIIENSGEAPANNIRYEGWGEWDDNLSNVINYLPPHHCQPISLTITMDSPRSETFKLTWDDESGKDHEWSETLSIYD